MDKRSQAPRSLEDRILSRLRGRGAGSIAMAEDYLDLASRETVDVTLHRLAKKGKIRRLARGVYDLPQQHPVLGALSPSPETVAQAVAKRQRSRIQPSGAYAANLLGLSEQVPAKVVFLTDGCSRRIKYGATTIELRQTTPRNMAAAGRLTGLLIQALRYLGKGQVTQHHVERLKRNIPLEERRAVRQDLALAPAWMHPILRELSEE